MSMSKEVKNEVKMYIANGWDIKEDTPEFVLLRRNSATMLGHVFIFVFFGWWTFLLANLVYQLAQKETKKILK